MIDVILNPKIHLRIREMWAYVSIDPEDDNEGVIGGNIGPGGAFIAFVGADPLMMEKLRPWVEHLVGKTNKKIALVKFTNRVHVEDIVAKNVG